MFIIKTKEGYVGRPYASYDDGPDLPERIIPRLPKEQREFAKQFPTRKEAVDFKEKHSITGSIIPL